MVLVGCGGGLCKVIFVFNPTKIIIGYVQLWLCWGFDKMTTRVFQKWPKGPGKESSFGFSPLLAKLSLSPSLAGLS